METALFLSLSDPLKILLLIIVFFVTYNDFSAYPKTALGDVAFLQYF